MEENPKIRSIDAFPVEVSGREMVAIRDPAGYTDKVLCISPEIFSLITFMNGENSIREIQAEYMRRYGILVYIEDIEHLLAQLDKHCFLENETFYNFYKQLQTEFKKAPVRPAQFSGKSYPDTREELQEFLDNSYETSGVNKINPLNIKKTVTGRLAPHIDLKVGYECYTYAYSDLDSESRPDVFVILGTAHTGMETPYVVTRKDFESLFGRLTTDVEFIDTLERVYGSSLTEEELVHKTEHSVEFQTIFIQHRLMGIDTGSNPVTIVPILCGSFHHLMEAHRYPEEDPEIGDFVEALHETIQKCGKRVCMVASADLAHLGLRFGATTAPDETMLRILEQQDRETLNYVEKMDGRGFYENVAQGNDPRHICGLACIYTMLAVLPDGEGEICRYQQWHDKPGGSVVTFASGRFYR